MIVSLNWLKRYVDIEESAENLARDLTMFGLNVEGVHAGEAPFSGVVFGVVREVRKHPRADRLSLCTVDVGAGEPLGIVCGAPNVRAGLNVAVAMHGAVLKDGFKIKRTKIRGERSEGMICSEIELGIGDDADGIIELDFSETPGTPLEERLGKGDVVLDVEVTPNRPDLLCHLGIAREVAARYGRTLRYPDRRALEYGAGCSLEVENFSDCPRYAAAFVDEVTIAPSPDWMQKLLVAAGLKPINNVVDVTNFVLMELGQPLHAFDRDRLQRDTIVVRRARPDETLVTLDDVKRKLTPEMLVIADAENPVALAGVMGGRDTEVTERTTRVLLESAMFDPRLVRRTRMDLKIETEASYRFEREADIGAMQEALERACHLIEEIGAGTPTPFVVERMVEGAPTDPRTIPLRVEQANRIMGTKLAAGEVAHLLERLDLGTSVMESIVEVSVPTFRRDLTEEIDLIEEIARVYGYENIGLEEAPRCTVYASGATSGARHEYMCRYLAARGFAEVITTSFMDGNDPDAFGWNAPDPRGEPLVISNPLTAGQSTLRTSLLPGLLGVVKRNVPAEQGGIRIFEMGKVFLKENGGGLPREEHHLTALFTRKARPVQWLGDDRPFDYFDMKGELEALFACVEIDGEIVQERMKGAPGHIFRWSLKQDVLAEGGAIARSILARYDIDDPVYYFDMLLDSLPSKPGGSRAFSPIIQYPAVKRDLCVVATGRTTFADIRNCITGQAKSLESIKIFDYYRGGRVGTGKRSYTFRLNFRSARGTLDDRTIDTEIEKILAALQRELGVTLRYE